MSTSMKRSDLYALVWDKPMTKIAAELGISDVGLAKACRRNGVPVPPRGHWAKLAAGKPSPKIRLPHPDQDVSIQLQTIDPKAKKDELEHQQQRKTLLEAKARSLAEKHETASKKTARTHPLVKATRAYVAKIPRLQRQYDRLPPGERWGIHVDRPPIVDKGRRFIRVPDGLVLTVSDQSVEWAIGLYEQLIATLASAGCKFLLAKRSDEREESVACELNGERIYFAFSEGYRKHVLLADERAERVKAGSYPEDWVWEPSGKFTWSVVGTEWQCKSQLSGNRAEVEAKQSLFAATCLHLLEELPKVRQERLDAEKKRQSEEAERARLQRQAAARKGQVEAAFRLVEQRAREDSVIAHLDELEAQLPTFVEPFRARLAIWIKVVRDELAQRSPYLEALAQTINGSYWRSGAPDWWPERERWPESPPPSPLA